MNYATVTITRNGNSITFTVLATDMTSQYQYTLDYSQLSARNDFADYTMWSLAFSGTNITVWNHFKETLPTRGTGQIIWSKAGSTFANLLVPFKSCSLDDCTITIGAGAKESVISPNIPVEEKESRFISRTFAFPSIRTVSVTNVVDGVDIVLQLCQDSRAYTSPQDIQKVATIYVDSSIGTTSSSQLTTDENGQATVRVYNDPYRVGQSGKLKSGFKYYTGILDTIFTTS